MKNIFGKWALLLLLLCGRAASAATVVDALGKTVEIKTPLQKIVVLNTDALEALRVLGADDKVVGVHSGIDKDGGLWPHMLQKPQVGRWNEPNVEAIVKLAPDMVLQYASTAPFLDERLKPFGIAVLRLDFYKIHTLEREMAVLGGLLGKQEDARRFGAWHREILNGIKQRLASVAVKKRAYLEHYSDYSTSGPGSGLQQLCEMAGCVNVAASLKGAYPKVSPEWVVAENPDIVLKMLGKVDSYLQKDASVYNRMRDSVAARPAWKHTRAVQNGQVHVMNGALTSSPRAAVAVAYVAQWMHPEAMRTLNPDALHQEYMEKFLRMPFKGRYFSDF